MFDSTHIPNINVSNKVKVQCPECYKLKDLELPLEGIKTDHPLIGVYLSSGIVCEHKFYFIADKQMKVRGFFNVDYEIPSKAI